ncbi:DUF3800 domain-containing protein [Bullifex porci]|uniref:DUF3800 domain-containing protein n=1 Tax=Bullifex porci TaxID=2606638 RepID=UPI0023F034F9|nr:DUF3800 domain-containing protein [Bullifex porci]MDD7255206.1 DUF3800 domain-containing protein [Bullifex porci]MDY2741085.1 DUF3800 domain-containing protein [Bullifex porci]
MKKTEDIKMYYFFDEAGDPQILGRKGVNLLQEGKASKVFIVGYLQVKEPKEFRKNLIKLQQEIVNDEYLQDIPSIKNSTCTQLHACMDCPEVREKVYKFLKKQDFKFQCIVARKKLDLFRKKFDLKESKIYKYLVSKLLENSLHLYSEIDCVFSSMGNVVRQDNMQEAINDAIASLKEKWHKDNTNTIRVIIQKNSEEPMLWAVDYVLWTIQRAYEKSDFRYYNYLKDKISLVFDIFDNDNYPNIYYSNKNPLEAKKIDPQKG